MKGLFVLACASLVACNAAVDSSDPAPDTKPAVAAPSGPEAEAVAPTAPTDADHARATSDRFGIGQRGAKAAPFFCRKDAFCEDFEEQAWKSRWSDAVTVSGGRLDMTDQSASAGKSALRVYSHDETASAFLLASKGDVGADWFGALEFAFRVDTIPGVYLGGPELSVKTSDGPITIRVALKPEGLVLEQLATDACRRDRCTTSSKIIAPSKEGHWYRVRIGFEVNPSQAAPYGRLEATVDGGELQSTDLTVPFTDGSIFLRAGITQGDRRAAFADLDDVSLLVR